MSARRPYTGAEVARIENMRGKGRTFKEIAQLLGRSEQSVSHRARASNIAPQPSTKAKVLTPAQQREIVAAVTAGASRTEMAIKFGVHRDTIGRLPGMPKAKPSAIGRTQVFSVTLPRALHNALRQRSLMTGQPQSEIVRRAVARELQR